MEPNKEKQEMTGQEVRRQEAGEQGIKPGEAGTQEKESKEGIMRYYTAIGAAVVVFVIAIIIIWQANGKTISETLGDSENEKKTEVSVKKEEEKATDDAILAVIEESLDESVRIVSEAAVAVNTRQEQLLAEAAAEEEAARKQAEEEAAQAEAEAQAEAKARAEAERAAQEQEQAQTQTQAEDSGNSSSESTEQPASDVYVEVPSQFVQSESLGAYVDEVIRLVNIERSNAGLSPLAKNVSVCQAANTRAVEIVTYFEHTRLDGRSCFSILDDMGISYTSSGENIAMGYRTPEEVVQGWMNSPGHRANILNEKFEEIGVGIAEVNGTLYWVQLFIRVNW